MVEPSLLSEDDHVIYVSGNDAAAKAQVTDILRNWFGWRSVVDLGNITTARRRNGAPPVAGVDARPGHAAVQLQDRALTGAAARNQRAGQNTRRSRATAR